MYSKKLSKVKFVCTSKRSNRKKHLLPQWRRPWGAGAATFKLERRCCQAKKIIYNKCHLFLCRFIVYTSLIPYETWNFWPLIYVLWVWDQGSPLSCLLIVIFIHTYKQKWKKHGWRDNSRRKINWSNANMGCGNSLPHLDIRFCSYWAFTSSFS